MRTFSPFCLYRSVAQIVLSNSIANKTRDDMSIRSIVKKCTPVSLHPPMISATQALSSWPNFRRAIKGVVLTRESIEISDQKAHEERRTKFAMQYFQESLERVSVWARSHTEESNFLYAITPASRLYLSHVLSMIFRAEPATVRSIFAEIEGDEQFRSHVDTRLRKLISGVDVIDIGRRLGWYAAARLLKPKVIVETGVDYGLGSCVMCAALLRNASEGHHGRYYGT